MTASRLGVPVAAVLCVSAVLTGCEVGLAPERTHKWLALGDSFSSGEGIPDAVDQPPAHRCQRSMSAYPSVAAAQVSADPPFEPVTFLACTGALAKMPTAGSPQQSENHSRRQLAQVRAEDRFDVISLTFGGNDAGFHEVIKACLLNMAGEYGTGYLLAGTIGLFIVNLTSGFCRIDENRTRAGIATLENALTALYRDTARYLKPDGRLYVIGYPHLFAPSNVWPLHVKLGSNMCSGVKAADADLLSKLGDDLNETIENAARAAHATVKSTGRVVSYLRTDDLFATHELCGTGHDWINPFPTVDNEDRGGFINRLSGSFHPNAEGHRAIANRLASRVQPHLGAAA